MECRFRKINGKQGIVGETGWAGKGSGRLDWNPWGATFEHWTGGRPEDAGSSQSSPKGLSRESGDLNDPFASEQLGSFTGEAGGGSEAPDSLRLPLILSASAGVMIPLGFDPRGLHS